MGQRGTTKADLQSKLNAVADQMYRVTYEVKEAQVPAESGEDTDEAGEGSDSESEEEPEMETVEYVVCTIHPFDQSVILDAFGVDVDATYDQFSITYGEAILNMSNALKMTMYGTASDGSVPPISDAELNLFLASLDCSGKRKELMRCALSLVGRVPYFWGGKSAPGWNSEWNTPKLVTSAGSSSTGTIRPYGLDCSGSRNGSIRRRLASPSTTGHGTSGMPPTPSPRRNCCPATWALWRCPAPSRSIMSCSMRARTSTEISSGSTAPAEQGWSSTHPIM